MSPQSRKRRARPPVGHVGDYRFQFTVAGPDLPGRGDRIADQTRAYKTMDSPRPVHTRARLARHTGHTRVSRHDDRTPTEAAPAAAATVAVRICLDTRARRVTMFNAKTFMLLAVCCMSATMVRCQVPGFGGCPEFDSQPDFDMNRYLGTWYEAEHYVNVFEIGTRCVKTNYTKAVDGRYLVSNEIMNRFTGVKRVLDGEIRLIVKGAESKMNIKYTTLPIAYSTEQMILETDYDSFAVVWSCSSLGVANTQNAWILTREKLAPGTVMQKAYGVLDKYKLSKTYFVKTDQNSCAIAEAAPNETNENKWRRRSL